MPNGPSGRLPRWRGCPVAPDVKFCGLTRAGDAAAAAAFGARYVGVIFAGGPRAIGPAAAAAVLAELPPAVGRVGVFGRAAAAEIAADAEAAGLTAVQLHADPTGDDVEGLRRLWDGEVWAAVRCPGTTLPAGAADLFRLADAVVLDAKVPGRLGGTGVPLAWGALRDAVEALRGRCRLVLAGGLTADNVAQAVRTLAPDVVDVSSGVEDAPGIKDHARMRAFAAAARNGA